MYATVGEQGAEMFQQSIYPVNSDNNKNHPSLPPSRFQRRSQRLRRQDPPSSSSEVTGTAPSDPATVSTQVTLSVGVSAPPTSLEVPTTSEGPPSSLSDSLPETLSTSSWHSFYLSPSEGPSASSSDSSPSPTSCPCTSTSPSITAPPPFTPSDERSPPPMSSATSSSSDTSVTDVPPPPSSSASASGSSIMSSVETPPPSSSGSSSSSGMRETTTPSPTDPPSTSATPPPSTSISISLSLSLTRDDPGGPDGVTSTPSTTSTPPSTSSGSTSSSSGGSSAGSTGPSSPERPGPSDSTESLRPTDDLTGTGPMQTDGSSLPMTTLSEAVTFTTTDASGSSLLTVPPKFTTLIVTTLPGGLFTTVTQVIANPPGVLNQDDANRDAVGAFFQNKGAVAGVFIAASLAICAIVLFIIFALRRRRYRVKNERDAEIAAGLAAAVSNQRFADDEDHPVVMRNVPSAMRGRSPWLDDDDDDRLVYHTSTGPVMYSNLYGVGPPTNNMPITSDIAYPATAASYTHARSNSGSPSPKRDLVGLPTTALEPASPTGWSPYGGAYLGRNSVSPAPTTSAPPSAYHGTGTHPTSVGHAPSSYGHRPPASAGRDGSGNGTGSGSGGTSLPSLMTATAPNHPNTPRLEDMYPPECEQFSRPASSAAVMGYAYEPDPVSHEHQIVTDLRAVQNGMRSPLSADIASVASRSAYSHDGYREWDDEENVLPREDSRLDPLMRMTGGIASAASVGPRDHEDYTRRVVPQPLPSPSAASHSHSLGHSMGHSYSTH